MDSEVRNQVSGSLRLKLISRRPLEFAGMRPRWLGLFLCCWLVPFVARADGIDLPIAIAYGVGIFLPLLLFNTTVEAPIMGRFLGIKFAELWPSWFKANVWSLLAGIPALILNEAITGWFLPIELGRRLRAYPLFLVIFIGVFFAATCLAEFLYARKVVRKAELMVGPRLLAKAVLLANLASYAVLGPVFFLIERPRTDVREFSADARWSKQPSLAVVAIGSGGSLETSSVDGRNHRVLVPHEVKDYVVSTDLKQVLYMGADDRFYLFKAGTNQMVPEVGFRCHAPEMDFSPGGRYVGFYKWDTHQLRVFDFSSGEFRDVPTFGNDIDGSLIWSSKEDTLYVKFRRDCWEIVLEPAIAYRNMTNSPTDFANHYGRVGTTSSYDGHSYSYHQDGTSKLAVQHGWGNRLVVYNQKNIALTLKDPAGQLGVEQAVFLEGTGEILVGLGDVVYILDAASKRMGPVMRGQQFIVLARPFSKQVDY